MNKRKMPCLIIPIKNTKQKTEGKRANIRKWTGL
jgi:hypothetical protein